MDTVHHPQDSSQIRAAIYTRVSTDDQAHEGHSLGEQDRRGRELIDREQWTHVGTYEDAGVSGSLRSRPALDRLLADVAAGQIDVVIVFALDRLSRDAGHMREVLLILDAAGVKVHASGQALDRATPEGRLQTGILAEFAEFERAKIRERSKIGIRARAEKGKPWGPKARYPYRKRADGHWEPDPEQVPIYLRIMRERAEDGRTASAICKRLNNDGIKGAHGGKWNATTIARTLRSRAALGEYEHGGEWHKGSHPPVIDIETWEAVQALDRMGDKYTPSKGGRKPNAHLFTNGLLRCHKCFGAMLPRSDSDTYVCRTRRMTHGTEACDMPNHRREDVDRAALAMFEQVFLDLDATRAHVHNDLRARLEEVGTQAHRAAREAAEKAAQLAKVERDYTAGDLSAPNFERFSARLGDELAAAEAERERLDAQAETVRASIGELDAEGDTLRRLARLRVSVLERVRTAEQQADVEALRAALAQCFTAMYLSSDGTLLGWEPRFRDGETPVDPEKGYPTWRSAHARQALPLDAGSASNDGPMSLSGTGVPEYPALTVAQPTKRARPARR